MREEITNECNHDTKKLNFNTEESLGNKLLVTEKHLIK